MVRRWRGRFFCQMVWAAALTVGVVGCRVSPWSGGQTAQAPAAGTPPAAATAGPSVADLQQAIDEARRQGSAGLAEAIASNNLYQPEAQARAGLRAEGSPPSSLDGPRDVMAEVRRLGAEDPGLQAQLLAELQAADPSLWPLVTRSFRSRVAYGRQLREKEALAARANAQAQVVQSPIPNPQSLAPVEPNPALANDQSAVGAPAEPRIARLPATDPSLLDPEWLGPTVGFPSGGLTGGTTPKNSSITRPERLSENGDRRPPLNDEGTCPPNNPGASPRFRTDAGAAALEIRNPAFCRGVRSFGAITRFERDEFTPGQRVLLYAEIDHFQTERRPDGFHTALRSSYRIFDAVGRQVASRESAVMEECTLGPRRDYFLGCDFRLSESLRPGRHTLRLAIEDLKTGQTAEASIGFTIVGHKKHEVTRKD